MPRVSSKVKLQERAPILEILDKEKGEGVVDVCGSFGKGRDYFPI